METSNGDLCDVIIFSGPLTKVCTCTLFFLQYGRNLTSVNTRQCENNWRISITRGQDDTTRTDDEAAAGT